jgi:cysteinyl-tRNA synthetase
MLRLHDSALGRVVDVVPREQGRFSMYVCGPTVYDLPHVGHGRAMLTWDVVRRWLTYCGLDVTHVVNVTDIDDNIIARAERDGRTEADVAAEFEAAWWAAADALGTLHPHEKPHATGYVRQMVETIGELVASGHAYATSDGVYLDTSTVPDYGLLAGQPLDSLRAGARVEENEEKRSPLDFVLWKGAKPGEPTWDAPFGDGRPGWHTECVVMSLALLGEGFDLHCGGQDLKFPHHENERAQAEALGKVFSRHWSHHGWVVIDDVKMSHSLGNFTSLTDLLSRSDARTYRLLVLRAHYRSPIEITEDTIADARRALERLDAVARRFDVEPVDLSVARSPGPEVASLLSAPSGDAAEFARAMDDDLDTARAVAVLFTLAKKANELADAGDLVAATASARLLAELAGAAGLALDSATATLDAPEAALARDRDVARTSGDYAAADRLRDELVGLGFIVEDTPEGTKVRRA